MNINIVARILIIAVVYLGILNQPYIYYELSRPFVSVVSIILAIQVFKNGNKTGFEYLYGAIAFIYNPILPFMHQRRLG